MTSEYDEVTVDFDRSWVEIKSEIESEIEKTLIVDSTFDSTVYKKPSPEKVQQTSPTSSQRSAKVQVQKIIKLEDCKIQDDPAPPDSPPDYRNYLIPNYTALSIVPEILKAKTKNEKEKERKTIKCQICSASFSKTFSLTRHLKLHSGEFIDLPGVRPNFL